MVPDNTATLDDAFESREMAERYLHTCYSYQPRPMYPEESLDIYSAGEAFGMQDGSGAVRLTSFFMMAVIYLEKFVKRIRARVKGGGNS